MRGSTKKHLLGHVLIIVVCFIIVLSTETGGSMASNLGMTVGYWIVPGFLWAIIAFFVLKDKKN